MNKPLPVSLLLRLSFCLILCGAFAVLFSNKLNAQTVTTGKSYINITRPSGGTFLPGDVIEIRATIAVTGGSNTAGSRLNSVRYNDTINTAKLTYVTGSLKMISNEGRLQYAYSDAADADSANINTGTGELRFNIGDNAGASDVSTQTNGITNGGRLWGGNFMRPSFYGNTCIRVYAYQVRIKTGTTIVDVDTTVILRAGNFRYRIGAATTDAQSTFPLYQMRITPDFGLCSNAFGTNALLGETGGTFGAGLAQNRAGGSAFVPAPYTFVNFSSGTPNDNFYGLANRTSADNSTSNNVAMPGSNRVFSIWDIIGDHTLAPNQLAGNPATSFGYAVIINASYETNRAFTQTITNVCEETYYEFSAWFRNICRRCGCDSTGKGAGSTGFIPAPGQDSSGVRPNLTFQIDGQDCYTSGNIAYTGQWIKKGFIFRTRPGQTSFTVTIRNNAPGGGGNDWAIDDISVKTCLPNMQYSPTLTPNVCRENALTIYDTVKSFFPNYTYYKWQRSIDAGLTWLDIGLPVGPIVPTWNGSAWWYVTAYTVPPTLTLPINLGDKYRVMVATSFLNLTNLTCRNTDASNMVTLNVLTCDPVLDVKLVNFSGRLENGHTNLKWTTTGTTSLDSFDVEKSIDGLHFQTIARVPGQHNNASSHNYTFIDPQAVTGKTWYRLRMFDEHKASAYSRILEISSGDKLFSFATVVNPFNNALNFDLNSGKRGTVKATLSDAAGRPLRTGIFEVQAGVNQFAFSNTGSLAPGIYILGVEQDGMMIVKKVMRQP